MRTDNTTSMLEKYKRRVHDLSMELHGDAIGDISNKLKNMGHKSMECLREFMRLNYLAILGLIAPRINFPTDRITLGKLISRIRMRFPWTNFITV